MINIKDINNDIIIIEESNPLIFSNQLKQEGTILAAFELIKYLFKEGLISELEMNSIRENYGIEACLQTV